jgi:hypothetical protein
MIQFLLGIVAGAGLFAAKLAHEQEAEAQRHQSLGVGRGGLPPRPPARTPVDAHYDAEAMATLVRWVADLASSPDRGDYVDLSPYISGQLPRDHVDRYGQVIVREHSAIGGSGFVQVKTVSGIRSQLRRVRAALAHKEGEPLVEPACRALDQELEVLDEVDVFGGHWPPSL